MSAGHARISIMRRKKKTRTFRVKKFCIQNAGGNPAMEQGDCRCAALHKDAGKRKKSGILGSLEAAFACPSVSPIIPAPLSENVV
jgi:hypothetical protein